MIDMNSPATETTYNEVSELLAAAEALPETIETDDLDGYVFDRNFAIATAKNLLSNLEKAKEKNGGEWIKVEELSGIDRLVEELKQMLWAEKIRTQSGQGPTREEYLALCLLRYNIKNLEPGESSLSSYENTRLWLVQTAVLLANRMEDYFEQKIKSHAPETPATSSSPEAQ